MADKEERAPEEDDYRKRLIEILMNYHDSSDESEYDYRNRIENLNTTANNIPNSISNATLQSSSSKPHPLPSNSQEEIPTSIIPVLEAASSDVLLGLHTDPTSLRTEPEKTDTVRPQVDDLTQLQPEDERNETDATVPGVQNEHTTTTPEPSMSPEQRIKQLEEKVEELNALRLDDAASISRSSRILLIYCFY